MIQLNGGRGRDGEHGRRSSCSRPRRSTTTSTTWPTRSACSRRASPDYFREAGIGDFNAYFRRARRIVRQQGRRPAGVVLFNLLEEVMVRNTRPYIRAAYPNATIKGKPVAFPNRTLHTVSYDLGADLRRPVRRDRRGHRLALARARTSWRRTRRSRPSRTKSSTSSRRAGKKGWSASSRPASSSGWSRASRRSA